MRRISWLSMAAGCMLLGLGSCGSDGEPNQKPETSPLIPSGTMTEFLKAQVSTGEKMFGAMAIDADGRGDNVLYSPYSHYMVMSMLANAAQDECASELLDWMDFSNVGEMNRYSASMRENFSKLDSDVTVNIANSVWMDTQARPAQEFTDALDEWYDCEAEVLDFTDISTMRGKVNSWVSEKTSGLIPEFLSEGMSLDAPVSVINTLYFKGSWTQPFSTSLTGKASFTDVSGNTSSVYMMNDRSMAGYYKAGDDYTSFTMSFGKERFAMTFILPADGMSVKDLVSARLDGKSLMDMVTWELSDKRSVNISLPKMSMDMEYILNDYMKMTGLRGIFENSMWEKLNPAGQFKVSAILQKIVFDMDEEGATAAAATGNVEYTDPGVSDLRFNVNRPFMFMVTEKACGVPLFMGVVNTL